MSLYVNHHVLQTSRDMRSSMHVATKASGVSLILYVFVRVTGSLIQPLTSLTTPLSAITEPGMDFILWNMTSAQLESGWLLSGWSHCCCARPAAWLTAG